MTGEVVVSTTCAVSQTIAVGGSYACSFVGRFTGNAGDDQTDIITAVAEDDEGNRATDDDDATVELTDALPGITVDKAASPLTLPEPGGDFTFSVTVTNDAAETLTLETLTDDVYGDLGGDCEVPQTLAIGGSYSCSFTGAFTGTPATPRRTPSPRSRPTTRATHPPTRTTPRSASPMCAHPSR